MDADITVRRILKVNHAGEYGAIRIYGAQIAVARHLYPHIVEVLSDIRGHEIEHCRRFREAMPERGARPCRVMSFWSLGGYVLGFVTALMGQRMIWICTEAVESAVHHHLEDQFRFLYGRDGELRSLIGSIQSEELSHLSEAQTRRGDAGPIQRGAVILIGAVTDALIWLSTWGASTRMIREMADEIHTQPWLVEMAIELKSKADQEKLGIALARLAAEDLSFRFSIDSQSGQTLLKGRDELHLDTMVDILKRTHKVEVKVGAPQVSYRETITRKAEVDYTHKKLTGATGQFARVILEIEPNEKGKGYAFESKIVDGTVPAEFIPGVEKGLTSVMSSGVVAGFPVLDVKVALVDGAYHEVDSSAIAFEIASRAALREGLQKAGSVLLEPVMKVEVTTPEDTLGGVISDLNSRRGQIAGTGSRGNAQFVNAMVPLANMFGYANSLRLMSQGRATFTMQFDHYVPVPLPQDDDPTFRPAIGMRA